MATNEIKTTKTAFSNQVEITDTTKTAFFTAQSVDMRIDRIAVSCDDTASQILNFFINDGTHSYQYESVSIPATSGTKNDGTVRTLDLLSSMTGLFKNYDNAGNKYTIIKTGWTFEVQMGAVTSGKKFHICIAGGLFD